MDCPSCNKEMIFVGHDVGIGTIIPGFHCNRCTVAIIDRNYFEAAMEQLASKRVFNISELPRKFAS